MSNSYFNATTVIARLSRARSSIQNAISEALEDAFDLLPAADALAGNKVAYNASTGMSNAYLLTVTPAITALSAGVTVHFKANHANTGPATLKLGDFEAKQIRDYRNLPLAAGAIPLDAIVTARYDGSIWRLNTITAENVPADNSADNTKLADMASGTIKGRATSGTGDPEDLTAAQARTILDVALQQTSVNDNTAGRGLVVGAFGIGGNTPSKTDMDAISVTGIYTAPNTSTTGAPTTGAEHLTLHANYTGSVALQIAARAAAAMRLYVRGKTGGVWQSWYEVFTQGNILGTVTESSGVPTGALIQNGSDSNGSYTRFADGTQICWTRISSEHSSQAIKENVWTFPVEFVDADIVVTGVTQSNNYYVTVDNRAAASVSVYTNTVDGSSTSQTRVVHCQAIGRWF